jgi:2-succinyl-5-enolpyruvyl-6-hydroxy-3-cyclohexene-1-carboxylate synthase
VADELWQCDPLATVAAAHDRAGDPSVASGWLNTWRVLETATQQAVDHALAGEAFPFEPSVYRSILSGLQGGATIFSSSSMPVRDVEAFAGIGRDDVRHLSNRGTNGIDGVLSTALGVRAPYNCDRVIVFIGDLATLYDIGALAAAKRHGIPITIVCVDNDGGGIFSFLPVAEFQEHFEDKIAAPSGTDLKAIVEAFGMDYSAPADADSLAAAVEKPGFVHLKTSRTANKAGHDAVVEHVLESVAAALAETGAFH